MAGSVSNWIADLHAGNASAGERLWSRYHRRMQRLARTRLPAQTRRVVDEDDVVVCAFENFLSGMSRGAFPHLADRGELWALLARITIVKAREQTRNHFRLRRSVKRLNADASSLLADLADPGLQPATAAALSDSLRFLLSALEGDELREIALARLHGYTNQEIADRVDRSLPTVERRLRLIRRIWERELPT